MTKKKKKSAKKSKKKAGTRKKSAKKKAAPAPAPEPAAAAEVAPGCVACKLLAHEYSNKEILHADDACLIIHIDDKVIGMARQHVGPAAECPDDDRVTPTTVRAYVSAKARWQAEFVVFPGGFNETEGAEDHFILELGGK